MEESQKGSKFEDLKLKLKHSRDIPRTQVFSASYSFNPKFRETLENIFPNKDYKLYVRLSDRFDNIEHLLILVQWRRDHWEIEARRLLTEVIEAC